MPLTVGDLGESEIRGQTDLTQNPVIRLRFSSVESWGEETLVEIHPTNRRHQNLGKPITEKLEINQQSHGYLFRLL